MGLMRGRGGRRSARGQNPYGRGRGGEGRFSNDWKKGLEFFQRLEKTGGFGADFSNGWKKFWRVFQRLEKRGADQKPSSGLRRGRMPHPRKGGFAQGDCPSPLGDGPVARQWPAARLEIAPPKRRRTGGGPWTCGAARCRTPGRGGTHGGGFQARGAKWGLGGERRRGRGQEGGR